MLSKLTFWIISRCLRLGAMLRFNPFTWDDETRTMSVKPEKTYFGCYKSRNFGFRIVGGLVIGNLVFGGVRILQSIYFLDKSFQEIMFNLLIFLISCLSNIVQLNTFCKPNEIASFGTLLFQMEKRLTSEFIVFSLLHETVT